MRVGAILAIVVALSACSSGGSDGDAGYSRQIPPPAPPVCPTCEDGSVCGYALDGGCGAEGHCVPVNAAAPACKAFNLCGCDGVVFLGRCDVPSGYSQAPSAGGYLACELDAGDASSE